MNLIATRAYSTLAFCAFIFCTPAQAKQPRSHKAIASFKHANPCPANGHTKGKCPGYVIDHIRPLCAGGPDTPVNMQSQGRAESKIKDAQEARECRMLRTGSRAG